VNITMPAPGLASFRGRSISLRFGVAIVVLFALMSIVSLIWTPYPPDAHATGAFDSPPSGAHLFGTDATGADVFSRVLSAATLDFGIALAVVAIALVVGTLWGALTGFYGGWFDRLTLRALQVMNSFPSLLLAMLVLSTLGRGLLNVILIVALIPLPDYVRLARAEILTKKNWQFAEAARMVGHRPLAVNASWVVSTVGALGFLGLGIEPGSAEWGSMISGGQAGIVSGRWWSAFFPGLGIFLLAAALHLIGDGTSDDDLVRHGH
jgi:peptide/nickel transport system permease protein